MSSFCTSSYITQRSDIVLHESNFVVQDHDLISLENKYKGRESRTRANLGIGIIICILYKL